MRQITELLSDDVIASFDIRPLKRVWKEILLHSYRPEPWHTTFAVIGALDNDQGLVKVSYHFTGELPHETFLGRGKEMAPTYAKVRDMSYHGRTLLHERVVWLPLKLLRVKLDGRYVDLRFSAPGFPVNAVRVTDMRRAFKLAPAARRTGDPGTAQGHADARGPARAPAVADLAGTPRLRQRLGADGPDPRRGRQRRAAVPLPATQPPRHQRVVRHRGGHAGLEEAARPRATTGSSRTGRCAGSC